MHHYSRLLLILSLAVIFFTSCNPDDPDPAQPSCKVVKSYAYDVGGPYDSAVYTYTNNKLTKVESTEYSITLEYTGENVTKRNFYVPGSTTLDAYEQITYNSNGTVSRMSRFSGSVEFQRFDFAYNGDKVTKTTMWYMNTGGLAKEQEVSYVYTGNNVTKIYYDDLVTGAHTDSISLAHDTNPNYFRRQSGQFLLSDPFFVDFEADILALLFSENNVVKAFDPLFPGDDTLFSYTTDSNGNLITFLQDGEIIFKYTYQCQ